jgi:hypothetical protein
LLRKVGYMLPITCTLAGLRTHWSAWYRIIGLDLRSCGLPKHHNGASNSRFLVLM